MSDEDDRNRWHGAHGEQQTLLDTSPPATRGECGELERPCPRTSCRHHLYLETERAGRPHHGVHNRPKIVPKDESCSLDVVAKKPDGIGYTSIGKLLHMTRRRAQQIGDRALVKVEVAHAVLEMVEEMRQRLPPGVVLDSAFPANSDTGSLLVTLVLVLPKKL